MITELNILSILIIHWIGDFILQSDLQAKNKSKSFYYLIDHTVTYSVTWLLSLIILGFLGFINLGIVGLISFISITFITHTITDYFTSRLNTKLHEKGDTHNFFVSIGFDQILHYIQLYLTFKYFII